MKNRITQLPNQKHFGLIAWLEQTRVILPLKGVECRFAVCGDLFHVQIDQVFHQDNSQPLDCLYTFPLPAGAAVHRCEMHVNGRVIRAQVEDEQRAREIVREKKAAGHRTALVEMERDNLFTLSLGNLQPDDLVVIRFAYFQTLTRLQDWTSFSIPFCPGIRYIPGTPLLRAPSGRAVADDTDQVPDASRISPPRMDRLHPDAAYLSVDGTIETPLGLVQDVSSPTHPVVVRDGDNLFCISIADGAAVPDRDLVVRWTEVPAKQLTPVGWVQRGEQESFALVRLQAPLSTAVSDDYEQDLYFLLDRSGSMQGLKWEKTAEAFREFVKILGPKDRVWLTLFEDEYRDFAEKPLPASQVMQDPQVVNLEALGTGGGTELLPALEHVLEKITQHSDGHIASLLLITDGQVGNEHQILRKLRRYPHVRIHTFGIDTTANDAFLKQMALQQLGTCHLVTPRDDIAGTVLRLGQRLRRPVLTSICAAGDWEPADERFPDLHAGEVFSVALKGAASAKQVMLEGKLPDGTSRSFCFDLVEKQEPALRLLWATRRMDRCLAREQKDEAVRLAKEHNLICEGTAFVAWDPVEKVAVSHRELYQPAMGPAACHLLDGCLGYLSAGSAPTESRQEDGIWLGSIPSKKKGNLFQRLLFSLSPDSSDFFTKLDARNYGVPLAALCPPLVGDMTKSWALIRRNPPSYAPLTETIYGLLCEWVLFKNEGLETRWQRIEELLALLANCKRNDSKRNEIVQAWIDSNLKSEKDYYDRVLNALAVGAMNLETQI